MKRLSVLTAALAIGVMLFYSCSKKEKLISPNATRFSQRAQSPDWALGQPIVNGVYKFANVNSNKVLMITGQSTDNGAVALQWDYATLTCQSWRVTDLTNGYFSILNAFSGKALDDPAGALTENLQLQQWDLYPNTNSEQWKIETIGLGAYKITNRASGKVATVDAASTADGAKVTQTTYGTGGNEKVWLPAQVAYKEAAGTGFFQRTSGITTMDGALSVLLPSGNVFWIFGDSGTSAVTGGTIPCSAGFVRSAGVLQSNNNWNQASATTILGTGGTDLFRINTASGYFTWPGAGFQINDTTYVYGINLQQSGSNIISAGPNKWCKMVSTPTMHVTGYSTLNDAGAAAANIGFGTHGFVKNTDGYVYAYGTKNIGLLTNGLYVARFPQSNPYAVWTYWNGSTWVASAASATSVYTLPGGDYSGTVSLIHSKFVVLSADFSLACDMGTGIEAAISSSPTGPFSTPKVIYNVDDKKQGHAPMFYQPVAHPEYINANNEILVTYCINHYNNANTSTCVPTCAQSGAPEDPNDYRPRGVRVLLSLIDPSL